MSTDWSHAVNAAERLGFSILVRNLDVEALSLPVYSRITTVESSEQAALIAEAVAAGSVNIYYDPQNYLDQAVVDKMVVLG
jgi:hypothetical protein